MNLQDALNLIKQVLDVATKRGVIENLDSAVAVATAFNVVSEAIKKQETPN